MGTTEHEKMSIHFKPGEYEFLGHDDKWTNVRTEEMMNTL